MAHHAYSYQRDIETGHLTVIGINKFVDNKKLAEQEVIKVDMNVAARQISKVNNIKMQRNQKEVERALAELKKACLGTENTMPYIIAAVKTYATLGEICGIMQTRSLYVNDGLVQSIKVYSDGSGYDLNKGSKKIKSVKLSQLGWGCLKLFCINDVQFLPGGVPKVYSKIIVQVRNEEKLKKTVEVQPISGRIVVKDE